MNIESLQNPKVKEWIKLKEKKYRNLTGTFLVEGRHLVEEAMKYHMVKEIITTEPCHFEVPIYYVNKKILKKLSSQVNAPNIAAVVKKIEEKEPTGNIIFLDGIQDPGNLGTILRSALAFNISTVVLSSNSVDLYNSKVIQSTQGFLFKLNIIRANAQDFLSHIKAKYFIIGTDVIKGVSPKIIKKTKPWCLVIGSEGQGISQEVKQYCQVFAKIPMNTQCESLNAGVSASILMYEFREEPYE